MGMFHCYVSLPEGTNEALPGAVTRMNQYTSRNQTASRVQNLTPHMQVPDLRCVTTALTSGGQTPARSEVAAMVHAVQSAHLTDPQATADFYTDAQYVCNLVQWCEEISNEVSPHKMSNFDLVSRLQDVWKPNQYKIHKLKSHRSIGEASDSRDLWCLIANHLVDRAAGAALDREVGEIKHMAQRINMNLINKNTNN